MEQITDGPAIGLLICAIQIILLLLRLFNIIKWHMLLVTLPTIASIVIFIGQYKSDIAVDTQNVCNIKVVDLTPPDLPTQPIIKDPIFKKGDELIIDFDSQEVLLNGADFLSQLDITSNFFSIPVGMAEVHCQSDTQNMNVVAEYRERWL